MRPLPLFVALAGLAACTPAAPPTVPSGGSLTPTRAEASCTRAVAGQTGGAGGTGRASATTGQATRATPDAPGAATPWECVADLSGETRRVHSSGTIASGAAD